MAVTTPCLVTGVTASPHLTSDSVSIVSARPLLPLALGFAFAANAVAAPVRVEPALEARLASASGPAPVLVLLREAPDSTAGTAGDDIARAVRPDRFQITGRLSAAPVLSGRLTREGLDELRRRADVESISLDAVVHPVGQIGAAQIGADRMAALGVTGFGRSVAVVDSGIDATHPDLAGKILGGFNFADKSNDLSDCSGHGTAVAGIVAGPQGIAPDAGLVALKIFGSRGGCGAALMSDVLSAVDWAVSHRDPLRIEVVNLSLADDRSRPGFCDSEEPASAAVFDAARAAGVTVVAAAGNGGGTDGVAWPACLSSVAAVGMVYSASVGPTVWGAPSTCRDPITAADAVPCASNSGSAVSVLAPGYGWVTQAAGGGVTRFSGTSAATPAAAGALLLARQARVLRDPALAADLLRATGVPILDPKSGRTTPRLDLSAALDATSPITGPCTSTAIPDGIPDGVTCQSFVSSLVGNVSSLTVALSIDHPDPTQLVATLTGPDGTSVVLMNRSGRPGHAFREVFGRTADPVEPLSAFAGRPTYGTWRLQVLDTVPGLSGRLLGWTLSIEPEAPAVAPPGGPIGALVPSVAHRAGRFGSFFTTDVQLFNSDSTTPANVTLRFSPADNDGLANGRTVDVTIPPLGTRVLSDIVGNIFRSSGYGPLFVNASPSVVAGSRTQSSAPHGGTYGLFAPALSPRAALAVGDKPLLLVPPFRTDGFRVNVGLTELAGKEMSAEISVRDQFGALKGSVTRRVPPLSADQVNDIYGALGVPPDENDRFEVRAVQGDGLIEAHATALDNITNDGIFVSGAQPVPDLLLPAASRAPGRFGSLYRTDVKIANPSASPIRVMISYIPTLGPSYSPVVIPIQGNETRLLVDILGLLFSPTEPISGALRLTALDGASIVASSRTYTAGDGGGAYGLAIDPMAAPAEATPGRRLALTFLAGSDATRTNVGFLETAGRTTHARLTLYAPDGSRLAARDLSLPPFAAFQLNDVFGGLGVPDRGEASAILEVMDGGALTAHVLRIDNVTNDASFVPGILLP